MAEEAEVVAGAGVGGDLIPRMEFDFIPCRLICQANWMGRLYAQPAEGATLECGGEVEPGRLFVLEQEDDAVNGFVRCKSCHPFDVWVPLRNLRLHKFDSPTESYVYIQRPMNKWWGHKQRLRFQSFRIQVSEGTPEHWAGYRESDEFRALPQWLRQWFEEKGYTYVSLIVGYVQPFDEDFGETLWEHHITLAYLALISDPVAADELQRNLQNLLACPLSK
jgi:hypothetical protein